MEQAQPDFLVIGGGISGLACAWFLQQRGAKVRVLEAGRAGGKIQTLQQQGYLIERGPNSTLDNRPGFHRLLTELELLTERVQPSAAAKRRYVLKNGHLHPLPGGPADFLRTPLFSWQDKLRLLAEPFISPAQQEESVADFVRRRLGQGFLDYAINPFVSGVYAGDPERLSVQAATARVYRLEAEQGSLFKGALALMRQKRSSQLETGPSGTLTSFKQGMQQLSECLRQRLATVLSEQCPVTALQPVAGGGWLVESATQQWQAKQVILACPAPQAAQLIAPWQPQVATLLGQIAYAEVASVSLAFARAQVEHALDGFGALFPRCEGVTTLGVLFPSSLFSGRAPDGKVLLTAFIGGRLHPGICQHSDEAISQQVLEDLRPLLGIRGQPEQHWVSRWPQAIPQYELGHLQRLQQAQQGLAAYPGVHWRANWSDGVSLADCVDQAAQLAERLLPA